MHFSKTGKMPSLALGNSHLSVELFTVDTLSAYGDSASDRQMDASSKLTNIVDQSDCYKGCEIICVCFMLNQL